MAFSMRQPFRLTSTLGIASKAILKPTTPIRAFHSSKPAANFFTSRTTAPVSTLAKARNAFRSSRTYMQQPVAPANNGTLLQKLAVGGAMVGGTLIAINLVFNRETREDGGMPPFERAYLNDTFMHTGLGIGIIGLSARAMFQSGFTYRLMATNPWVVMIGGLALSIGTMMGTRAVEPTNYIPKYGLWAAFNVTQGALLAPLLFMAPPALIARAGLYTLAMMGSIAFVGATAKQEKYLYLGGPLLAGVAIVAVSGFAPLVLPATAIRTLAFTENIWLYGGLAVFGGFTLYDVQKILMHARLAEQGRIAKDPVNESISLELDFLNIFIRMVQILMMQQGRRK
ncbi:Growth hormone-inducible transmembrane [Hyphodiscus hymeniophilus]|uniref:Growth hormone-inducible transmembrane n=1 Tax=Hyphodiscus hymeniophilus TaxID=353542 RepID=A0A9P7B0G9_9HELO|nr:Growth hormone-inducible transmembrane [Hyphodiscus hymeniophilus]